MMLYVDRHHEGDSISILRPGKRILEKSCAILRQEGYGGVTLLTIPRSVEEAEPYVFHSFLV